MCCCLGMAVKAPQLCAVSLEKLGVIAELCRASLFQGLVGGVGEQMEIYEMVLS